ncbi:hypothetical protein ADUPG1_009451, partial [Aduncisulcus paluster]
METSPVFSAPPVSQRSLKCVFDHHAEEFTSSVPTIMQIRSPTISLPAPSSKPKQLVSGNSRGKFSTALLRRTDKTSIYRPFELSDCGEYKEITIDKRILVKLAKDRELVVTAAKNIAQTADERVSELYTMLKRYSGKYSKSQEKLKNIASIVQQLQQTLDFEEREKVKFRLKVEEMEKRISAMSSSHHTCAICMDKA